MKHCLKTFTVGMAIWASLILPCYAHAPNQSYVFLSFREDSISGRYEITADDLNKALGLNLNRVLTKDALLKHQKEIQSYLASKSSFGSTKKNNYKLHFVDPSVLPGGEHGDYAQLNFKLQDVGEIPEKLEIRYEAFFDALPKHEGLVVIAHDWKAGIHETNPIPVLFFSANNTEQELPTSKSASVLIGFIAMIKLGIWHISIGIDHILFLFALLLPSVLRSSSKDDLSYESNKNGFWTPVEKFKPALINVIKIVTFFTIAHTITLSLASLQIFNLPSRLVESIIAISIALAALHNIRPVAIGKEWIIAFIFGLFHGFGFASVLAEKNFGGDFLVLTLLGFNLGVEIGQLAIIVMIFPILFVLRKTFLYSGIVLFGSIMLILISIYWFIERAFDVDFPIGGYILRSLGLL